MHWARWTLSILYFHHPRRRFLSSAAKTIRMTNQSLSLTPPERLFRKCLLDCRKEMVDVNGMKDLEIRFTGGWVRDKLLGTSSHDIDVALSTMTGEKYGMALKSFMDSHGQKYEDEAAREGFNAQIKNLHKIEANPEKSKHLETITTKMFGIDVDLVNLRKEVYDEISRNPQVEFGTPEEDALRRDATVNALFYNLDTQQVEDFTGRGLDDMAKRIIRTPLEPYQTFKDDPLRVLRLIRFASRLDYEIDPAALRSMADKSIHAALRLKISRERVGVEVAKIMAGPDPYRGLIYINDLDLYDTVFADPSSKTSEVDPSKCPVVYSGLNRILSEDSAICLGLRPKDDPVLSWTLAAYVPWAELGAAAVTAAREALKSPNAITKVLGEAIHHRARISEILTNVQKEVATRAEVGVTLRNSGQSWRFQVLYCMLCELSAKPYEDVVQRYQRFVEFIREEKLDDAENLKPILNGNEIKKVLEVQKAGSWLKSALDVVIEWQFANPNATAEEAKSMLKQKKGELIPS